MCCSGYLNLETDAMDLMHLVVFLKSVRKLFNTTNIAPDVTLWIS